MAKSDDLDKPVNPKNMKPGQRYLVRYEIPVKGVPSRGEFIDVFKGYQWKDDLEEIRYTYWNQQPELAAGDILEVFTAKWK